MSMTYTKQLLVHVLYSSTFESDETPVYESVLRLYGYILRPSFVGTHDVLVLILYSVDMTYILYIQLFFGFHLLTSKRLTNR